MCRAQETFDRPNPKYWNRLYRQNKDGSFTDVTEAAGLAKAGNGNYGMGVAVGDFDNDGYSDLYVTSYGKNILYHNNGNGTFTDVTKKRRALKQAGGQHRRAFSTMTTTDISTCFVTRYMVWDESHNKDCGGSLPYLFVLP